MSVRDRFADVCKSLRMLAMALLPLTQYPPLFSSLCRFYSDIKSVQFWGLDVEDYSILIDHLVEDHVLK